MESRRSAAALLKLLAGTTRARGVPPDIVLSPHGHRWRAAWWIASMLQPVGMDIGQSIRHCIHPLLGILLFLGDLNTSFIAKPQKGRDKLWLA